MLANNNPDFDANSLEHYERVAPVFEFGVGIMLVLLGAQVFWNFLRGRLHRSHRYVMDVARQGSTIPTRWNPPDGCLR